MEDSGTITPVDMKEFKAAVFDSIDEMSLLRRDSLIDKRQPENVELPKAVSFTDISRASLEIRDSIRHTPCGKSSMSADLGMEVYLKKDILQVTGSFKERGACCALKRLSPEKRKRGVIAASAGNHALALSYHGQQMGISVTVVTPVNAPLAKVNTCKKYEATVIQQGQNFAESYTHAKKLAEEKNMTYINGYDHPDIIAGAGSVGLEILEQVRDVEAIIVPTGGGGLIAGISTAVKRISPHVKIIGVETEACPGMSRSLEAGNPVSVESVSSLADGLGVSLVGANAFESCKDKIDEMILVPEDMIALAILRLLEEEKVVCEGAGAIGLAAILSGKLDYLRGKKVVVLLCGGNIDITVLGRCIDRGLAAEGRLVKCVVQVSDKPGGIARIVNTIAKLGGSIKDIHHERAWVTTNVFQVQNTVVIEVNDRQHGQDILDEIQKELRIISHTLKYK